MKLEWLGQSGFRLAEAQASLVVDPFGDMSDAVAAGMRWDYADFSDLPADVVLLSHDHPDHNGVFRVSGDAELIASPVGRVQTRLGEVVGIASEHDSCAGLERGINSILCFSFAERRVCHLGDLGQAALRAEQRDAIGPVDVLFVPVGGGGFTIDGIGAAEVVRELSPQMVVPMHYQTAAIDVLEPVDPFLEALAPIRVIRYDEPSISLDETLDSPPGTVLIPAPPLAG